MNQLAKNRFSLVKKSSSLEEKSATQYQYQSGPSKSGLRSEM
jgi:hypothetical protein